MSDEVATAIAADPAEDTIFGKILRKEIPCEFIHEDDRVRAHDSVTANILCVMLIAHCLIHKQHVNAIHYLQVKIFNNNNFSFLDSISATVCGLSRYQCSGADAFSGHSEEDNFTAVESQ